MLFLLFGDWGRGKCSGIVVRRYRRFSFGVGGYMDSEYFELIEFNC